MVEGVCVGAGLGLPVGLPLVELPQPDSRQARKVEPRASSKGLHEAWRRAEIAHLESRPDLFFDAFLG